LFCLLFFVRTSFLSRQSSLRCRNALACVFLSSTRALLRSPSRSLSLFLACNFVVSAFIWLLNRLTGQMRDDPVMVFPLLSFMSSFSCFLSAALTTLALRHKFSLPMMLIQTFAFAPRFQALRSATSFLGISGTSFHLFLAALIPFSYHPHSDPTSRSPFGGFFSSSSIFSFSLPLPPMPHLCKSCRFCGA